MFENTVDGSEIQRSPVDMVNIPSFIGFQHHPNGGKRLGISEPSTTYVCPIEDNSCPRMGGETVFEKLKPVPKKNDVSFPKKGFSASMSAFGSWVVAYHHQKFGIHPKITLLLSPFCTR